ncbi:MAG: hypothetical protein F9K18_07820 [Thermoanaerobaculia bacterium]|nr:MAG: hypothetical protein F9K18_07820 [Thermoanaerobaculia bacterium]
MRQNAIFLMLGIGGSLASALTASAPRAVSSYPTSGSDRAAVTDAAGRRARVPVSTAERRPATRGAGTWSALGPPGGDVTDAAFSPADPGLALAGVAPSSGLAGNLYRSTDGGATWAPVPALAGRSVYDVEFAPSGKVYVATMDSVWTSEDGGLAWTQLVLGIGLNDQVLDVALDPSDPLVLWVGVGDAFGAQSMLVLRSPDGGVTWTNRTPPLAAAISCQAVAVRPGAPDTVVAAFGGAFGGGQVWVSTDGGTSWQDRSSGLPANPMRAAVFAGARLLVGGGQLFGGQNVGLFASDDLGVTWTPLHDGTWPLRVVSDVAVDPLDADVLLAATDGAGVNRTTDGGASWQIGIGGTAGVAAQSLRFRPASSTDLLLGASSLGVFRSLDGGAAFAPSSSGISELDLFAIHVSPADPLQIAVAFEGLNNGGVFSSADGGVTWVLEPVPPTRYSNVRFAPDGTLYAVSSGPSTIAPEGLYRRESGGTWTGLGPNQGGLFESDLKALRFSASSPGLILMGGSDFGVAGFEVTIWRSANGGTTWDKEHEGAANDFVLDIEIVADGQDQVMVASYDGFTAPQEGGVLRSVDGGLSWGPALSGLPGFLRLPRVCTPAGDPQAFVLSGWLSFSTGGLFRSGDGGATWSATGWVGDPVMDVACDPRVGRFLYLVTSGDERAELSVDGGASFSPFGAGLETARAPRELAAGSHAIPRLLLASGSGSYATELVPTLFADGFESGDTSAWSSSVP